MRVFAFKHKILYRIGLEEENEEEEWRASPSGNNRPWRISDTFLMDDDDDEDEDEYGEEKKKKRRSPFSFPFSLRFYIKS